MSKSNTAWDALCAVTDDLWNKGKGPFGGRQEAFQAACKKRPDLAAVAVNPMGAPIVVKKAATATVQPQAAPVQEKPRSFEAEMAASANNPLAKACERLAGMKEST
jgi:hypothetical protein